MGFDPGRLLGQRPHDGAIETAWRAIVDVFNASWSLQSVARISLADLVN